MANERAVPELTQNMAIQLNERVSLRPIIDALASRIVAAETGRKLSPIPIGRKLDKRPPERPTISRRPRFASRACHDAGAAI